MKNLFVPSERQQILDRLGKLQAGTTRQMLAHCAIALEVGAGDRVLPLVSDARDFAKEKARLVAVVSRFGDEGPSAADGRMHSFLGRLKGDEWGVMMHKHLDHHLRQFGV